MTSYGDKGPKPDKGKFLSFDHLLFYVGNAKQAASYYVTRLGFEYLAYQGLETGHRKYAKHVVKQNKIVFVFVTPYDSEDASFGQYLTKHGDGVKDIAFDVEDLDVIVSRAKERGGKIIKDIWEEKDEFGTCRFATIQTIDDFTHTFVDRKNYSGIFLPGFMPHYAQNDPILKLLPNIDLDYVDHFDINLPESGMEPLAEWYTDILMFHRFWSVDDSQIHTEYSAMKAIFVANYEETVKVSLNEPANGKARSQIQEFVDYNDGPGIQHIALHTDDIVKSCSKLRERGMGFLQVPDTYYDLLKTKLKEDNFQIQEDIEVLRKLKILIDYDENGYLLQIFTKTMEDRPTLFLEVIQRRNHNGFGAGNFKALFEAIELDQAQRGNL